MTCSRHWRDTSPAEYSPPSVRLEDLALPRALPLSLPSDLIRQRPDVLAAEATAHAASANIGVATAAMLPSVTLSGGIGASTTTLSSLVPANGHAWSVGADATAPLFEGGTLWFKRKAAVDDYRQAIALYRQTVIGAFEQVADTLRAIDHDAQILRPRMRPCRRLSKPCNWFKPTIRRALLPI